MKKSLTYFTISALVLSIVSSAAIMTNSAPEATAVEPALLAETSADSLEIKNSLKTGDMTYIITDAAGAKSKLFHGSTLADSSEEVPVALNIKYYLDGAEIPAAELAGKSGHVKIEFNYTSTATYQNKFVPFLAATGVDLDSNKFSNVKLNNGKILSEGDDLLVVGYSFAGLSENLGADLLPSTFVLEADVENFALENTYTFTTNTIFADLDVSKLSSVDEIVASINQLSAGLDQIISGSSELESGLKTLGAKVQSELIPKLAALSSGLSELSANSAGLNENVQNTFADLLAKIQQAALLATANGDATTAYVLNQIYAGYSANLPALYEGLATYTGTVDYIAAQVSALDTSELENGVSALIDGSGKLSSGLTTFKSTGTDRLADFANNNLAPLAANLRASVYAANNYAPTKLIFKTPSIK